MKFSTLKLFFEKHVYGTSVMIHRENKLKTKLSVKHQSNIKTQVNNKDNGDGGHNA